MKGRKEDDEESERVSALASYALPVSVSDLSALCDQIG